MQENDRKTYLFESAPLGKAVMTLAIPTVISSLVTVLYNLADTYFVSMLNDSVQNAAVTLAAPVMLAFNAVNNLFGVGASSLMSRSLGCKDYESVAKSSAFGFYCSLICGLLFGLLCFVSAPHCSDCWAPTQKPSPPPTGTCSGPSAWAPRRRY